MKICGVNRMGILIKLFEDNPNERILRDIADRLWQGGVIIYPTDTIYAIGCDIMNPKAVRRVASLKGLKAEKADFSIICGSQSEIAEYAKVSNTLFKEMKRLLPGPYTFILPATSKLPNVLMNKRKTVGVRIPDNFIPRSIVEVLGNPLLTTSIETEDEITETDPELIYETYRDKVDMVIDGGYGKNTASTVLDCTGNEIVVLREGLGLF